MCRAVRYSSTRRFCYVTVACRGEIQSGCERETSFTFVFHSTIEVVIKTRNLNLLPTLFHYASPKVSPVVLFVAFGVHLA